MFVLSHYTCVYTCAHLFCVLLSPLSILLYRPVASSVSRASKRIRVPGAANRRRQPTKGTTAVAQEGINRKEVI